VEAIVIETLLNLLFRCPHRHLTRPFTPLGKKGAPDSETYVVCLDCAKQFAYDFKEMRIGKAIDHAHDACVIPPKIPRPVKKKLTYAIGVAVPVAVLLGAALTAKKPNAEEKREKPGKPDPGPGPE
jgi:hypothetical protein